MALTYAQFSNEVLALALLSNDQNFTTNLPNAIDYAEQRIYRELDLLSTVTRDSSAALTAGTRTFSLPSSIGTFVTVKEINIITPAGTAADSGTRNPAVPTSEAMLDLCWGSVTGSTVPRLFAMLDQGTVLFGPWPDQAYKVEVVGTIRPAPLSTTNVTTFLSVYLPDLFLQAAMIFVSATKGNFGAMSHSPQEAQSFETQYQSLFKSAMVEELRKKFQGDAWTSQEPSPIAQPPRS